MPDLVALLFGAVIIAVFSYERFNRATYEGGRQLERLVSLLSPDQLRARRIVLNAYVFYIVTLLLIYFFLRAYAEVLPLLGGPDLASGAVGASKLPTLPADGAAGVTTGFIPGSDPGEFPWTQALSSAVDPIATRSPGDIGIDASVSLTIALIMVGLAPTFPILRRFEDWMRSAAHRLAGIPTRVIGAVEDLSRNALEIDVDSVGSVPSDTLLIPRGDWERMAHYEAAATGQLTAPEDFRRDLQLVFAVSAWILDRKLKLANTSGRERFDKLEEELRKRKTILVLELDEKSRYRPGDRHSAEALGDAPEQGESNGEPDVKRASWERLAEDVDKLADDLCILLALYVEHEIIVSEQSPAASADTSRSPIRQQILAKKKLLAFLADLFGDQSMNAHVRSHALLVWLWTFGVVLIVAVAWSLLPGRFETELQRGALDDAYWRALSYAFTAFNAYCIPMLVALAIRDGGLQSNRWRSMWQVHWTEEIPQAALVVFASWAVATLFIVGLALWQAAFDQGGFAANEQDVWSTLKRSFEYNAPMPLRGAVLALIAVILLDARSESAWSMSPRQPFLSSFAWATRAAAIMAVCGGITRTLTSWSALDATRQSLDAIDRGLIVYAAIYSAIIGFCVVFCAAEALVNQRRVLGRSAEADTGGWAHTPTPAE